MAYHPRPSYVFNPSTHKLANILIGAFAASLPVSIAAAVLFESLILLVWLLGGEWRQKLRALVNSRLSTLIVLFILYNILSLAWTSDISYGIDYIEKYRHFLLIPAISYYLLSTKIKHVINIFIFSTALTATISIGIFGGLFSINGIPQYDPSPFLNHVDFSVYLALSSLLSLVFFLNNPSPRSRRIYLFLFLFLAFTLFINAGRTGQLGFVFGLFYLILAISQRKIMTAWTLIIIIPSLIATAYFTSPVFQSRIHHGIADFEKLQKDNDYTGSLGVRVALWDIGLKLAKEKPVFGYGIGNERSAMKKYLETTQDYNHKTVSILKSFSDNHNAFLTLLLQGGILNLAIMTAFFLVFWLLKVPDPSLNLAKNTFVIIFVIAAMTGNALHLFATMTLLSLFAALFDKSARKPFDVLA